MTSPTTDRRLGLAGNTAYKVPATVVATANVTLSGEQTIDGVACKAINAAGRPDRVLATAQTDGTQNGLWDVSTAAWTRSIDANGNYDLANGTQVQISQGSTNARSVYLLTTLDPITVGTTAQTWVASPAVGFLAALAAATGASLIGWLRNAAGAVYSTLFRWLDWQAPSVAEWMTDAQRADCQAGTATLDCSAAVQAAVTFAIANNRNLKNPYKKVLLSSAVNVDRQVDGAAFDSFFTIHGGGFYVKTAIAMFSSSIAFTTAPVTQLVRFNQVNFEASGTGFDAYVLDDARFLRTHFVGCDFVKIKCLYAPSVITQAINFYRCNMRRWVGIFFRALNVNFDIKFHGCIAEAGDQFARMAFPVGCSFVQNEIEGCSGTALRLWGAQALSVHGSNYFEQNDCDIDIRPAAAESSFGVSIKGNYFSHTPGGAYAPTSTYSLRWGNCFNCISEGNYGTTYLHEFNAGAQVRVDDYAVTAVSNAPGIYYRPPYNFPVFSAYATVAQSITTSTFTKITFGAEEFDSNSNFATSTFTPTVAGYYSIEGVVKVAGTNITRVAVGLYKNGSEFARLSDVPLASVATWMMTVVSSGVSMNGTTDTLELWVFVTATTPTVAFNAATDTSRFSARYLRNNT